MEFLDRMRFTFEDFLNPFFTGETLDDMMQHLPEYRMENTKKFIETCWKFFRDMRNHLEFYANIALPAASVFLRQKLKCYATH
jgi:hypothetical protein